MASQRILLVLAKPIAAPDIAARLVKESLCNPKNWLPRVQTAGFAAVSRSRISLAKMNNIVRLTMRAFLAHFCK